MEHYSNVIPLTQQVNDSYGRTSTSTSTTTSRARAIIPVTADEVKSLVVQVEIKLTDAMVTWIVRTSNANGIRIDALGRAIEEAALAPAPSFAYLRAIINRMVNQQIRTAKEFDEGQERYQRRNASRPQTTEQEEHHNAPVARYPKHNPALDYQQRDIKDSDYEDFFVDLSKPQRGCNG